VLDKVYNTGEPYVGMEVPIMLARDEGLVPEVRYFNFSYQPMHDENRQIYSILVFGYEVTDQVLAQNKQKEIQEKISEELEVQVQLRTSELRDAIKALRQKNAELESFNYVSSHDLQEPLRKIHVFTAQILANDVASLSDSGKDAFSRIQNAAKRMQTLIQDLLVYSRTDIGDRKFEKTNLTNIVKEVQAELEDTIQEKGATVDVQSLCEVNVNRFQFRQMINNLLCNALKFSRPGVPPCIVISDGIRKGAQLFLENPSLPEDRLDAEKEYCHISIADNGIGFDPLYNTKIFDVFQRLHKREDYVGTGIGLAIVKKIVENHNGFITASGKLNEGATFDIYLPA
jgi:light-regulated signal transduction histidine kinase (bacteriophytochrome)